MGASLIPVHPPVDVRAELARLRAALKALQCEQTPADGGGFHCNECGYHTAAGQPERHRASCRTYLSKRALGELP